MRENVRRAAECALLGVIWLAFSLPLITAGAAWAAVAEVCHAWQRDEEPPLVRTFVSVVRRDLRGGFAMTVLGLVAVTPFLEAKVSLDVHLPGAPAEAAALGLIGTVAACLVLLAFPQRAASRGDMGWGAAFRAVAGLSVARPWAIPLTAIAVGVAAVLVYAYPPLLVFIAGPAGYAVSAVHTRAASAGEADGPSVRRHVSGTGTR